MSWHRCECRICGHKMPGVTPRHDVSREDKFQLAREYASGVPTAELRAKYGVDSHTLINWIRSCDPAALGQRKSFLTHQRATKKERDRAAAIELARAEGRLCRICWEPVVSRKRITCSSECSKLWTATRYHLDNERTTVQRRANARWALTHPDLVPEATLKFSRKILAGESYNGHGRWTNSPQVEAALSRVIELRAGKSAPEQATA